MEERHELGPLISSQHREKVLSYYRLAREEGATVVTGGGVPEFGNALDNGFYVQPTIYTGLAESARCVKEEIFGPGVPHRAFRFGRRSGRHGERHEVRSRGIDLDQRI